MTTGARLSPDEAPPAITRRSGARLWRLLRLHGDFAPLYGGVICAALAASLGPDAGSRALWIAGAQVIPVVLIALALQARVFRFVLPRHGLGQDLDDFEREIEVLRSKIQEEFQNIRSERETPGHWSVRAKALLDEVNSASGESSSARQSLADARADLEELVSEGTARMAEVDAEEAHLRRRLDHLEAFVARQRRWSSAFTAGLGLTRAMYVAAGMALLALGEFRALEVLATGDYESRPGSVLAAIGFGFGAMFVAALVPTRPDDGD